MPASGTSRDRDLVPAVLAEYGAHTRAAVRRYLPDQEPRRFLYDLVADYPSRGGKMMRPSLCIATARAFGATIGEAVNTAASIELLHNALLIHDDIQDESEQRRGRPTMHKEHGVPIAINVGDTLGLLSFRPLIENRRLLGLALTMQLLEEAELVSQRSAEGQAMELGWRRDNVEISESDYLEMVLKKTSWLATIYPCRVGALIGSRGRLDPARFTPFGFFLGAAFQIQDDLLNLVADERYGKEANGDLWEGKRTLMLIQFFQRCTPEEAARARALLAKSREDKSEEEVLWLRRQFDRYAVIDSCRQIAHGLAGAALVEFRRAFADAPDSRDKRFVEGLAMWVFERN